MPPAPTSTSQRSVLHLAWPVILSFVLRQLLVFVDSIFARRIGDNAVAAIGLSYPFEFLLVAFWVGVGNGMTSLLSRAIGAHEGQRADQVIRTTQRMVLAIVPLFAIVGAAIWFVAPFFVQEPGERGGIPPDVLQPFRVYATVIVMGTAFTGFWSVIPDCIVKAHHDMKATMWAGMWSNWVNVGLNCLFVLVFHWGMFGIAFSTVMGRLAGLAYALRRARLHEDRRRAAGLDTVPGVHEKPLRALLALAVPAAVTYLLMATESAMVNFVISRNVNATESLAAYTNYYRYLALFLMPIIASGVALLPYVGRSWGHRDLRGIRRAFRDVAGASCLYTLFLVLPVTLLFRPWLAALVAKSALATSLTETALLAAPLACLVAVPFFACRPIFDGMQRPVPGLLVATLRYVALTLPAAFIGAAVADRLGVPEVHGIIVGLIVATTLSSALFLVWMWRALGLLEQELAR